MNINTDNPIIKFSDAGKPFQYDKLFYATFDKYIVEYKNVRLDKLTEKDQSICLARIIKKMEVNGVPVQEFFKKELDDWTNLENHERVFKLCELMAKDMFACFDRNCRDNYDNFPQSDRFYCVNENGEKDYVLLDEMIKKGVFSKKTRSLESEYFMNLKARFEAGELPKSSAK